MNVYLAVYLAGSFFALGCILGNIKKEDWATKIFLLVFSFILSWLAVGVFLGNIMEILRKDEKKKEVDS